MYEETDDLIGMGDFASFLRKVRKVGKKARGVVSRVRSRIRRARGKGRRVAAVVSSEIEQTRRAVAPSAARAPRAVQLETARAPAGAGAMEWVKQNPMIVAGGALAAVLLLARRK